MVERNAAYIPDEVWEKFASGEIDHFVYDVQAKLAKAVYADGHVEELDTTVTPEMIAEDQRMNWASLSRDAVRIVYEGTLVVENPRFHTQIKGFTS